jgi:hypothetical protein
MLDAVVETGVARIGDSASIRLDFPAAFGQLSASPRGERED